MKALKVTGKINEEGQLTLDQPLTTDKNRRVEIIVLIPEAETPNDELSQAEVLADLRQAWHEARTGQTIPVAQLWEDLDDD